MSENKSFDIVIYGATGFTGSLVASYFAEHVDPAKVKWAIAGRNEDKLLQVKAGFVSQFPNAAAAECIIADSDSPGSLEDMCQSSKIVLTTVGPYAQYGEPLVKACIAAGTHYLDITGEPDFVKDMLTKYDDAAKAKGVLIINCCGFDSIPADAGAYFTAAQLEKGPKTILGYVTANGTFSGGTWASAINAFSKIRQSGMPRGASLGSGKNIGKRLPAIHFEKSLNKWAIPMPVIDPWMVKRSSELQQENYGLHFQYQQYLGMKDLPSLGMLLAGVAGLVIAAQFEISRNLLLNYRKSGEGPSAEERAKGYFKVTFLGEGGGSKVKCSVSGGDPGYTETAKMLTESALTVLNHYDELKVKGGVVTPAGALGYFLIDRLIAAGIKFTVEG